MSWAGKRKVIYLLVLIIIIAGVLAVPIYEHFFNVPATCFDGKQNQGEQGVDCGGPCVKLCSALELPPVVLWTRAFSLVSNIYTAGARIENPNAGAEAFSVPYTFTFYDQNNNVIGTRSGTTFIPAGQDFLIVESDIAFASQQLGSTTTSTPVRTTLQFIAPIIWERAPDALTDFNDVKIENIADSFSSTQSPSVSADIVNTSFTDLPQIDVGVILYDADGNAVGVSNTYVDSLPHQTSQHIVFSWIEPFVPPPARPPEFLYVVNQLPPQ